MKSIAAIPKCNCVFIMLLQEDPVSPKEQELSDLKHSLEDTQPVGVIIDCCKTLDQVSYSRLL